MAKPRNKVKIYSIIAVNHGKFKKTVCSAKTEKEIYKKLNELLKESKKVMFPVRYNVEEHVMIPSEHELVIIKCSDLTDSKVSKVRLDNGEFVNYQTTDDNWVVIDRVSYDVEESFWVYGYHPRMQRKTFEWVLENFILKDRKNPLMFKTVQIYNNKVLIDCNGDFEMVICKNKNDSIRFYNLIEKYATINKCKYIAFMGDLVNSKHKSDWIQRIMNKTNWNSQKVTRLSTRD